MKKILSYILLSAALGTLMVSCKKKDADVISSFDQLGVGSYVTLVKNNNLILDFANLNTTSAEIVVKEYGKPVDKIKIYVTQGAATTNRSNWKLVKEVPVPTVGAEVKLNVKATEIATALGVSPSALLPGSSFTLYNQVITKEGLSFDIANMQGDFPTIPQYNMAMTWTAVLVCPFQASAWGGVGATFSARVLQDGWADYSVGDVINNITITSATRITFSQLWLTDANTKPVYVDINAATGAATMPRQIYGDYLSFGITNISCATSGSNNWVFSCVNTITLTLNHTAGSTNYGTYLLRLQKL